MRQLFSLFLLLLFVNITVVPLVYQIFNDEPIIANFTSPEEETEHKSVKNQPKVLPFNYPKTLLRNGAESCFSIIFLEHYTNQFFPSVQLPPPK